MHFAARPLAAVLLIAAGLVPLASCATARAPVIRASAPRIVEFRDVRLWDGSGASGREHVDVIVQDGVVAQIRDSVVPSASTSPSSEVLVIDGQGRTLLPGFVDAHVHVTSDGTAPWQHDGLTVDDTMPRLLASGVTTAWDLSAPTSTIEGLRARMQRHELEGPSLRHTNFPIAQRDGHPLPLLAAAHPGLMSRLASLVLPQVTSGEDAPAVVEHVLSQPVDFVKVMADEIPAGAPHMSPETLAAVVRAARERGALVVVHAGSVPLAVAAAQAGATVLAHLPWNGVLTDDDAKRIAASGTVVVPTLTTFEHPEEIGRGVYEPGALARALGPDEIVDGVTGSEGLRVRDTPMLAGFVHDLSTQRPHWHDSLRALRDAGVPILVGSDSPMAGGIPGAAFHDEAQALQAAGFTPAELLVAMTSRPAHVLAHDDAEGLVAVGRRADLVLVQGDPQTDIAACSRVVVTLHDGRVITPLSPAAAPAPAR